MIYYTLRPSSPLGISNPSLHGGGMHICQNYRHISFLRLSSLLENPNAPLLQSFLLDSYKECFSVIVQYSMISLYYSLCESGVVQLKVNGWVNVSFCLPHKVHNLNQGMLTINVRQLQ